MRLGLSPEPKVWEAEHLRPFFGLGADPLKAAPCQTRRQWRTHILVQYIHHDKDSPALLRAPDIAAWWANKVVNKYDGVILSKKKLCLSGCEDERFKDLFSSFLQWSILVLRVWEKMSMRWKISVREGHCMKWSWRTRKQTTSVLNFSLKE